MLEIGTGSGYQAAVLAEIVEAGLQHRDRARARGARAAHARQDGYRNVEVRTGNGYLGWPDRAPFDRIIVTAAPPEIPKALVDQLAVGGIMVVPVGTALSGDCDHDEDAQGVTEKRTIEVRFVPMVRNRWGLGIRD